MGDIYAFNSEKSNSELLIENEIERQLYLLKDIDWFHGLLERKDAEKKITTNGEFLVRLSRGNESKFVVSTKWNGKYLHVIVKNDVDVNKKQLTYHIVPKFKFNTISELIVFHKAEQYPLSNTSEAVLYRAVVATDVGKKEHKFRKSVRAGHKHQSKMIPRSGSETLLATSQRYSANFPSLNTSLTALPTTVTDAPCKPHKPSFRLSSSKLVLTGNRPSNIAIRNEQLFDDDNGGDYTDYVQSRDAVGGLEREQMRRGLSCGGLSPSLFGLNCSGGTRDKDATMISQPLPRPSYSVYVTHGVTSDNADTYVAPGRLGNGSARPLTRDDSGTYLPLRRDSAPAFMVSGRVSNTSGLRGNSSSVYVAPGNSSSVYITPGNTVNSSSASVSPNIMTPTSATTPTTLHSPSFTIGSFLDLGLSNYPLSCCGPVEGAFDPVAINKAAAFLLSHPNNPLALCAHLIDELHRIFRVICADITLFKPGYRCLFMIGSDQCQKDLVIRQSTLTNFVKATIVNTTSNDRRVQLILFWIKCADNLLTLVRDMFHFRSVVTAIFSDQIAGLKAWKTLYRNDPSMKIQMLSLRKAISDGCFMRTDLDQCVPDIVQLYSVFTNDDNDDDFDGFWQISSEIMHWSAQSFDDASTWLARIRSDMNSITTVPFLRELVQTETLLSLILGRNTISSADIRPLMAKVEECIGVMAELRNNSTQ